MPPPWRTMSPNTPARWNSWRPATCVANGRNAFAAITALRMLIPTSKRCWQLPFPIPVEKIAEVSGLLLRRHLPCVIEKPPGRSLEEAASLAILARETGTRHMVSLNRRFNPYLNQALEWSREQGQPHYIAARMLRHA